MVDTGYLWGISSTQQTTQTQPQIQVQTPESANAARMLSSLTAGQTIEGRVVNVGTDGTGQRIAQIDLGNNATVQARLSGDLTLSQGQTVSFQVRSNMNGTISLNPLYQNTAADSMALRALATAGLSSDSSTLQMVRDMMQSGLPIDRDSLLAMNTARQEFPQIDMGTLTQMRALNLPVTQENIQQFTNYQNYQHQIVNSVNDIMAGLPQAFTTMAATGRGVQALDMYSNLVQMFATMEQPIVDPTYLSASAATASADVTGDVTKDLPGSPDQNTANLLGGGDGDEPALLQQEQGRQGSVQQGGTAANQAAADSVRVSIGGEAARQGVQLTANGTLPTPEGNPRTAAAQGDAALSADGKALAMQEGAKGEIIGDNAGRAQQTAGAQGTNQAAQPASVTVLNTGTTLPLSNTFLSLSRDLGMPQEMLARLNGSDPTASPVTSQELLKTLGEMYEHSAHLSPEIDRNWSQLFSSKDFTNILQDTISKQWLLRPEDVESPDNISQLYQRLHAQTKALTQLLSGTLGNETTLSKNVANLSNNIDFMNQINQMYQYVQLPLRLRDQNAHGDLYVYTNKKKLSRDDGTVSAILHLDMDNLGPLDVYVKMRDNKVNTNFYLADDAALDLIHEHIDELDKRLQKRGYSMSAQMMLQDDKTADDRAVDEMLRVNPAASNIVSHTAFDARA